MDLKRIISPIVIATIILFSSCKSNITTAYCAKCGKEASTTLSGSLEYLLEEDIPRNKCKLITQGIYSAHLCKSCFDTPTVKG